MFSKGQNEKSTKSSTGKGISLSMRDVVVVFVMFVVALILVFTFGLMIGQNYKGQQVADIASGQEGTQPPITSHGSISGISGTPVQEINLAADGNVGPGASTAPASGTPNAESTPPVSPSVTPSPETRTSGNNVVTPVKPSEKKPESSPLRVTESSSTEKRNLSTTVAPPEKSKDRPKPKEAEKAKPAVVTPKTTPALPSDPGGMWVVQVLATSSMDEAREVARRLETNGFSSFIVKPTPTSPDKLYRVRAGLFRDHTNAISLSEKLRKKGFKQPYVARVQE